MVSQPLLIDQHIGSATYIETMRDESFSIHQVEHIHDLYDDFIFNQNSECYAFFYDLKSLSGCYRFDKSNSVSCEMIDFSYF